MKHLLLTFTALLFVTGQEHARPTNHTPHRTAAIDVYRMASVIEAEARGEPCKCQTLAGEVLENRARWQGVTVAKSSLVGVNAMRPSKKSIEIAKSVLSKTHNHNLRFFYNPATATDFRWVAKNRAKKKVVCGGHLFFE